MCSRPIGRASTGSEQSARYDRAIVWAAAFEKRDRYHEASITLLRQLAQQGTQLHAPAFLLIEVACAISRRSGSEETGTLAATRLSAHPAIIFHPVDNQLLQTAQALGTALSLRAADSLYAATARLSMLRLLRGTPSSLHAEEPYRRSNGPGAEFTAFDDNQSHRRFLPPRSFSVRRFGV